MGLRLTTSWIRTTSPRQDASTIVRLAMESRSGEIPRATFPQLPLPPRKVFTGPWVLKKALPSTEVRLPDAGIKVHATNTT